MKPDTKQTIKDLFNLLFWGGLILMTGIYLSDRLMDLMNKYR